MLRCGKQKMLSNFFTSSLFHNLWKSKWKTEKGFAVPIFSLVEKNFAFQHFRKSKEGKCAFCPHISFLFFLENRGVHRFHISLHIFSFSTGHLFKNFHKRFPFFSFPHFTIVFPHRFPLGMPRKRKGDNPCNAWTFRTFPTFLQSLKPLLLKNSYDLSFNCEKGNLCFFRFVERASRAVFLHFSKSE